MQELVSTTRQHKSKGFQAARTCLGQSIVFLLTLYSLASSATSLGNTFIIGTLHDPLTIYPLQQLSGATPAVRQLINPPILAVRNDGRIICILCKEIPEFETRKDDERGESTFIIALELKKKLKWGDGTAITPQDVKYTLETMAKADYGKGREPILPIRRIEMDSKNKNKLRLVLTHKRSDAFQLFAISLLPSGKAELIQKLQKDPRDAAWWTKLQDPGLYYGAYVVKSASAERWQLTSNREGSWEEAPTQDLELRTFDSLPALAKSLQAGELDQTAEGELNWQQWTELSALAPELEQKFSVQSRPSNTLELVLLNMHSPLLVNPQLRQILHHAIQRTSLAEKIMQGLATPAFAFLHPAQLERLGEKIADPFQTLRVSQLLEQSGAKKTADGILTLEGQKISLVFSCSETRFKSGLYQPIVDDLRKIGVEVKLDLHNEEEYIRQTLPHRRFRDMACMRWQLPALTPPLNLMHSLAIPNSENNYLGSNFGGWNQSVADRILENMQKDAELHQLLRLQSRLDKQFMSDLPSLPLVYLPEIWLNRKDQSNKEIEETQLLISLYPPAIDLPARVKL